MIISKYALTALAIAALSSAAPTYASNAGSGYINGVIGHRAGVMFFNQSGARQPRPACSTVDRWAVNTSTPAGQALASVVLTAMAQNRSVIVYGTGACDVWADTETVDYLQIN